MRHRRRGRQLGRSSPHRRAMLKNLASALFLTERETDELDDNAPKVKGRVITTVAKAKEVRPLVEKCITIARKSLEHERNAENFETDAERNSEAWKKWRESDQWRQWADARAPVVAARRRALQLLGDKQAVSILFEEVAPRFEDRPGGYTRILKLANVRLGDGGAQAILEFVGENNRVFATSDKSAGQKPAFETESEADEAPAEEDVTEDEVASEASSEEASSEEAAGEAEEK